jgi:TolB-like protein/tetratricopeptide (TPR) repeat protein
MSSPLRFGTFELDVRSRELRNLKERREGVPGDSVERREGVAGDGAARVRLQEQPFEILRLMLERPGDVVTRDELRQRLWPDGTFVDFEHSLNAAIKRLRAALGDDADHPSFIETVPRRGYRFIGSVPSPGDHGAARGPASPRVRLVVLPFSNLSDDSGQEYFSDGLTEELIAQLGPLCRGQVGIIARWSSMFFKGSLQRAREIGEALNAEYLLEGSTRRDGSRVRITARLVEAATEAHLWSETFDRTTSDWLSVQADVAGRVARSLLRELVPAARAIVAPRDHPAAYQAYLKGRYHWARPGDAGLDEALRCFTDAVREAPDFAAALGALGRVRIASAEYYHELPRQALAAARDAAARALEIDPTVSEAHAVMGDVRRSVDGDWAAAEASYAEALSLNASNEQALRSYGLMLALEGRFTEALACVDRARELDPMCLATNTAASWTRYVSGDYEAAIVYCRHTLEMDPEFINTHRVLAAAQLQAGRHEEAAAQLELALTFAEAHPVLLAWLAHVKAVMGCRSHAQALIARARALETTRYVPPFHLALAHTGLGALDEAFDALEQAWADRDPALATFDAEPRFEPLRSDARYRVLMERMRVPRTRVRA